MVKIIKLYTRGFPYTHTHTDTHIYTTSKHTHTQTYTHTHIHIHKHTNTDTHTQTHTYTHNYTYTHTHTHTHTYSDILRHTQTYINHLLYIFRLIGPGTAATPRETQIPKGAISFITPAVVVPPTETRGEGQFLWGLLSLIYKERERKRENIPGTVIKIYIKQCQ